MTPEELAKRSDRVVFLDTETTGLEPETARIIEIGVVDWWGTPIVNHLIATDQPIPATITNLTGIRQEDVDPKRSKVALPWPMAWREVIRACRKKSVVIYNADFDVRMIKMMNRRYDTPDVDEVINAHCAMLMYSEYRNEVDRKRGKLRWFGLNKARESFGIPDVQNHRAVGDAHMTANVVRRMAENWTAKMEGRAAEQGRLTI